jgi:carbonic anhydrase
MIGCPVPESYVRASELALENVNNLDSNIDIFCKNYYSFITKDTEEKVKAGAMEEAIRKEVLDNVEKQLANLKEQSIINKQFIIMAHDYAHEKGLKIEDVINGMKAVNSACPEIINFINKLKG